MIYLTELEVPNYTDVPGITAKHIGIASALIDTYIGKDLSAKQYEEIIALNKKGISRLKNRPVLSIDSVKVIYQTPFGFNEESVSTSSVFFDEYGYIKFFGANSVNQMLFNVMPNSLKITYQAGFEEVPEELKIACAALAVNIKKRGLGNEKEITDLDVKIVLADTSVFTPDIRMLCQKYRGV